MSWERVRTGAAGLGMALLLVALPLVFSKHFYGIFFTPKAVVLYLGVAALVVALAAAGLERGGIEVRLTIVELIALALLGWGLLSALFAVSRVTGFFGLLNWGTGWLFWLACLVIWAAVRRLDFSEIERLAVLWTGLAVASLLGLLALLQIIGAQSAIGNPIYFGAYMALMLTVGLELSLRARHVAAVIASSVGLVLVTIGLVGNLSRGPWLGAAVGVVIWVVLRARSRTVRGGLVVSLAIIVLVAAVFAWQLPHLSGATTGVGTRVEGGGSTMLATGEPNTIGTRIELWKVAAAAALERPVLGWGSGNFVTAGRQHMTAKLMSAEPERFTDAHNLFTEFAATWGIPGLLLLLAWFAAVIVQLWRAERQRSRTGLLSSASPPAARGSLGLAPLGLAVLGTFFVCSLATPQQVAVAPTAMLLVGLSLSWRQAAALPKTRVFSLKPTRSGSAAIAGFVASVVLVGVVAAAGYRLARADMHYSQGVTTGAFSAESVVAFQAAVNADPWIERYWIALGDTQGLSAALSHDTRLSATAAANLRRGLGLSPRDLEGLLSLSRVLLDLDDAAGAKTAAEQAASYAPLEPRARATLARALAVVGERDCALAELDQARAGNAGNPDVITVILAGLAYRDLGDKAKAIELLEQVQAAGFNDPLAAQALAELNPAR